MDLRLATLVAAILALALIAIGYAKFSADCGLITPDHAAPVADRNISENKFSNGNGPGQTKCFLKRAGDDPVALFTAILTLFTALLFVATCGLWYMAVRQAGDMQDSIRAAKRSADAAKIAADAAVQASETTSKQYERDGEALVARERAYYAFSSFGIHFAHFEGRMTQWIFEVLWKNYGNRPPRNVVSCTSMSFFDKPVEDDFAFPDRPINPDEPYAKRVFAAPQATIKGGMIPVSVADLQAIAAGRKFLSIWGWVEYDDGFAGTPRRRSEFAADVQMIGIVTQPNPGHANIRQHNRHNGTDDECMKHPTT